MPVFANLMERAYQLIKAGHMKQIARGNGWPRVVQANAFNGDVHPLTGHRLVSLLRHGGHADGCGACHDANEHADFT